MSIPKVAFLVCELPLPYLALPCVAIPMAARNVGLLVGERERERTKPHVYILVAAKVEHISYYCFVLRGRRKEMYAEDWRKLRMLC